MKEKFKNLKPGCHIHLMGVCGTAMASLAVLLKERGFQITGSDQNVYPPMSTFLEQKGVTIMEGYRPENLHPRPDFVVVGNVISSHFPEAKALMEMGIPYGSLPETMGDFVIEDRHSVVVCGTHGKTTTTSMASWVAEQAELQPGFLIGGLAKNFGTSFQNPKGEWFVIEGDEYDSAFFSKVPKFTYYKPKTAILTSVEFDHADIYPNMDGILKAFQSLMTTLDPEGLLLYNAEDRNIAKLLPSYPGRTVSYGWSVGDWSLENLEMDRKGMSFQVNYKNRGQERIQLPMFGSYNALNALAVYALAKTLDWKVDLRSAFQNFQGIRRRQEVIGEPQGRLIIEDFAHHPTAVSGTLQSFQKIKGQGRVVAIFEPRSATSRRNYFQDQYQKALSFADTAYVCRPYDRESLGDEAMDVDALCKGLEDGHAFEKVEDILGPIRENTRPGDIIVIMSNGGFQGIYEKILTTFS